MLYSKQVLVSLLAFTALISSAVADEIPGATAKTIRVAAYNLENLFDATHDENRLDWFYTPLSHPGKVQGCKDAGPAHERSCLATDWTPEKAQLKIEQMKRALHSHGPLPEILGVEEVENAAILAEFARAAGYSHSILEEGEDERGIDVGLLYQGDKVTYLEHRSHRLEIPTNKTRDILAVYFKLKNAADADAVLAVYVNHWPSQSNPAADRVRAARKLLEIIAADKARFGKTKLNAVALGDFNTVDADYPNPFFSVLQDTTRPDSLLDMRALHKVAAPELARDFPLGTYFFPPKMLWQDLDHIFVSRGLADGAGVEALPRTFRIHNSLPVTAPVSYTSGFLMGSLVNGAPKGYDVNATTPETAGFTDHFAVSVEIQYP